MTADHWTGLIQSTLPRIRIYELGQCLGVPPGDVLRRAQAVDIDVRTVLQSVDRDSVGKILNDYQHPSTNVNGAVPDPWVVRKLLSDLGTEPVIERSAEPWPESSELETAPEPALPASPKDEEVDPGQIEDPAELEPEPTFGAEPEPELAEAEPEPTFGAEPEPELAEAESEPIPDPVPDSAQGSIAKFRNWYKNFGSGAGLSAEGRRVILVAAMIVLGTALLVSTLTALRPMYAAESEVVVTIGGSSDAERELQSFSVVASSQSVLAPVAEELEIPLTDLRESLSSEIVGDSAVLRFLVTDRSPEQALVINEAIVASYLLIANQPVDQAQVDFLDSEIAGVRQSLEDTADRLETLDAAEATIDATRLRIETDQAVAQGRLANLESRLVDLRSGGETSSAGISFVEGQIDETRALLDALVAELQTLASADTVTALAEAERLRDDRDALREQLGQLEARKVELELDQVAGPRARVLAPAHVLEEPVGLTPFQAVALGLAVGGVIAFAWVLGVTQLRRRHD